MNLLCLSDFNQDNIVAKAGDVCRFPLGVAHRLVDSWPGSWRVIVFPAGSWSPDSAAGINVAADLGEVEKAIEAPPVDKMIHAAHKAKAHKRK